VNGANSDIRLLLTIEPYEINGLPGSARTGHSRIAAVLPLCRNFRHSTQKKNGDLKKAAVWTCVKCLPHVTPSQIRGMIHHELVCRRAGTPEEFDVNPV